MAHGDCPIGGRVLADRLGRDRRFADRTRRLEATGRQVRRAASPRSDEAVLGAAVAALAVDDHARGEHQAAREAAPGERAQQHRGAEVVVAGVVGDVADVGAEPDHRRLVADVLDPVQRALDRGGVTHVADDVLGAWIDRPSVAVEHADRDAGIERGLDDVRADEAGASGDEQHACPG
jgi:hypothetical protein